MTIDAAALLAAAPLVAGGELPPLPEDDLLALDEPMRRFVAGHIDRGRTHDGRLAQLLAAVIGDAKFGIVYNERTHTAAEAFRRREANCLSFTAMFVALAREAGVEASFQEVDVPPDWTLGTDLFVLNRHVNALAPSRSGPDRVVDFDMADFRAAYDRRVIPDSRARAHYHSNLGVERLQAGEVLPALAHFRRALAEDPTFAPAWVNLGVLYLREGHPDWARAAWWQAVAVAPDEDVAISNLERSYRQAGRVAEADALLERIRQFRQGNPYYRYHLAQRALEEGDVDGAIAHLRFAVREKPMEDRFLALLGLSYLRRGDVDRARRWLAQAEAVAEDAGARERYHGKLERLRRSGPG